MILHSVDGETVARATGLDINLPVVAVVAMEGDQALAAWGLAWNDGRCWLWLFLENPKPEYRWIVIREARKMLRRAAQLGNPEVFTVRDFEVETSARLLTLLGFRFHRIEKGREIWLFSPLCPA